MLLRPVILQTVVAFVTYRWVTNADQAIQRADRAEVVADLERREVKRQEEEIKLKNQLDEGIQDVLVTLNAAANGYYIEHARIGQDNVLFRVGYAVNILIARLQSFHEERAELGRTRQVAQLLDVALRDGGPLPQMTGTCFDPVIIRLQSQANARRKYPPQQNNPSQYPFSWRNE